MTRKNPNPAIIDGRRARTHNFPTKGAQEKKKADMGIYIALGITLVFTLLAAWFMSIVLVRKAREQGDGQPGGAASESVLKSFFIVLGVILALAVAVVVVGLLANYALSLLTDLSERQRMQYAGLVAVAAFLLFLLLPGFLRGNAAKAGREESGGG